MNVTDPLRAVKLRQLTANYEAHVRLIATELGSLRIATDATEG